MRIRMNGSFEKDSRKNTERRRNGAGKKNERCEEKSSVRKNELEYS